MSNIVNTKQLAMYLGVTDQTLYNWRKNNGLPYMQLTRKKILYNLEEVMEWTKSRK